jgi:hypothetical protein
MSQDHPRRKSEKVHRKGIPYTMYQHNLAYTSFTAFWGKNVINLNNKDIDYKTLEELDNNIYHTAI